METKRIKDMILNKNFWLSLGGFTALVCLFFFYTGWKELQQDLEKKNQEKLQIDYSVEVRGQSIYINGDEVYKFLPVPGGSITVDDSTGTRTITVESFLLGEIPVSSTLQSYIVDGKKVTDGYAEKFMDFPSKEGTAENWHDLINKLNKITGHKFRLPTNDEWEYAARGGRLSMKYKYAGSNNINAVANYKDNCSGLANFALKSKLPNELGFYDMSGGVWELTSTKIEDVFPQIKQQTNMAEMMKEKNPELYEMAKKYKDALICRGGGYDSPAMECELNYRPWMILHKTGARLLMEY